MGAGIVFIATIPAYLAGAVALLMGAGWLASLGILMATGTALCLLIGLAVALRPTQDTAQGRSHAAPRTSAIQG